MPRHRRTPSRQRAVETSEYVAFLCRIIDGYGDRIAEDPAALVHRRELEQRLRDAVNRGVFGANRGGGCPYSLAEIAACDGTSRQMVFKRLAPGEAAWAAREAAKAGGPVVRLGDVRAARAAALAEAGVDDRTGSERERHALA